MLPFILGNMFDYVETKDDNISSLNHFHTYYKKLKWSSKSGYVAEAIEKIVISVKNKLEYIAQYKFMSVSIFGFLRYSIDTAANSGMKCGSVRVSTNMNINIYRSTQINSVRIKAKIKIN